jgi:hypothetical protein
MALNATARENAAANVKVRKFKIGSAQILAMHTTQVSNVIAGVPRYVVMPEWVYLMHPAGTAYVGASLFQLRWGTTVLLAGALTGFHDAAAVSRLYIPGPTTSAGAFDPEIVTNQVGVAVNAFLSAPVTTGNFAIYGLVGYRLLPHSLVSS